jgi:hypothetical protein
MLRSADELVNTPDPAWPVLHQMINAAGPSVRVLEADVSDGRREIESLQVSAKSFLGATAYHVGAILIDSGWLRVFGCGHTECQWSITTATRWLGSGAGVRPPEALVVAVDVLGGLFAINGGVLPGIPPGHVAYFGPDTLRWDDTGGGYSAWIEAMLSSEHRAAFYADLRWIGWEREVGVLSPDTGLSVYPPLYTRESRPIQATRRAPVPIQELAALGMNAASQMDG